MADTVMIVDDDPDIRNLVQAALEAEGFDAVPVSDGETALKRFESVAPDIIVLDVLMPGMSGTELCREIRQESEVPILFLSGRGDDIDRIIGLELGADDYMAKPFNPRELVARVRAILRRTTSAPGAAPEENVIRHGKLSIDLERFETHFDEQPIELTKTEFMLLQTLMRRPGKVYSRAELIRGAYEDSIYVSDRTIDSHIRRLRNKLHEVGADPIETVRGVGYKLTDPR
jgi:two-component system OmpR family response regulator